MAGKGNNWAREEQFRYIYIEWLVVAKSHKIAP